MSRRFLSVLVGVVLASSVTAEAADGTFTVRVVDHENDGADGWDGFDIVIKVNNVEQINEHNSGDFDYVVDMDYGDTIYADLTSSFDDYNLKLLDDQGRLRDESSLGISFEPDTVTSTFDIWTVKVVEVVYSDLGYTITITINGVVYTDYDVSGYDYILYVVPEDEVYVELYSLGGDYDLRLYDENGDLAASSSRTPSLEPDWVEATVGVYASGGGVGCVPGAAAGAFGLLAPLAAALFALRRR